LNVASPPDAPWSRVVELLADGQPVETILSGWQLNEHRLSELLLAAWRAGVAVKPEWVVSPAMRSPLFQALDERPDLSPVQLSSLFKGRVSPIIIRLLKVIRGEGRGLETALFDENSFFERFHDDIAGARKEILLVCPDLKSRHWRKYLDGIRHVLVQEGQVAFFCARVSNLIEDEVRKEGIVIIEKRSNANLVLIDGEILWEGSMNFLLPPVGEEHVRRTVSKLQADEVRELHDLFL
ncbi:MAG: hypothetical protein KDB53_13245, partial [Planctomycetes bacterium]|nr:hypothetical protein [Planctomycetota bacterium]